MHSMQFSRFQSGLLSVKAKYHIERNRKLIKWTDYSFEKEQLNIYSIDFPKASKVENFLRANSLYNYSQWIIELEMKAKLALLHRFISHRNKNMRPQRWLSSTGTDRVFVKSLSCTNPYASWQMHCIPPRKVFCLHTKKERRIRAHSP